MRDSGTAVLMLVAVVVVGMTMYVIVGSGFDPSSILCWLELACRR